MCIIYTYKDFSWIGPDVDTTISKTKNDKNDTYLIQSEYCLLESSIQFKYICDNQDGKYVILSDYCLLEDTVLGLPRSYNECFKDIMKCIEDEIYLANQRGDDATKIIKTCLNCHKIILFIF